MSVSALFHHTSLPEKHSFQLFHHALATPLTALFCTIAELERREKSSDLDIHLKNLEKTTQKISQLADTFLLPTSRQSQKEFLLAASLQSAVSFFSHTHATISLIISPSLKTFICRGNPILFEESIVCLITNALNSYTENGEKLVLITARKNKNYVEIIVRDYGKGIGWWQRPLIFFSGISFTKGGSGIGLPFAKHVIENCFNGKLILTTSQNSGTEVTYYLPGNLSNSSQTLSP